MDEIRTFKYLIYFFYRGISTTISVYRGKTGIVEYVAAGVVSGSLYKLNMGPRGWIVGGGLGKF